MDILRNANDGQLKIDFNFRSEESENHEIVVNWLKFDCKEYDNRWAIGGKRLTNNNTKIAWANWNNEFASFQHKICSFSECFVSTIQMNTNTFPISTLRKNGKCVILWVRSIKTFRVAGFHCYFWWFFCGFARQKRKYIIRNLYFFLPKFFVWSWFNWWEWKLKCEIVREKFN